MTNNFWKNRRVFVTGHTGFKGSWLSLWLTRLGAKVYGYSLTPKRNNSLFNILKLEKIIHSSKIGNILNLKTLEKAILDANPSIVFHLAAQPLVSEGYKYPLSTYKVNVIGTLNILEILKKNKSIKAILNITSDKCYEINNYNKTFRESDKLGGLDPYSSSKACSEILTSTYYKSYFKNKNIAVATARSGNVIGGGDWSENRLIPDFFKCLKKNHELLIRSPDSIRPWQHVLEPLKGYLSLAEKLTNDNQKFSRAWNFGPKRNNYKTVLWIVKFLSKNINNNNYKIKSENFIDETKILKINSSDAIKYLGWKNKWEIKETLNQTLDWYMSFESKKNMLDFSIKQIDLYQRL